MKDYKNLQDCIEQLEMCNYECEGGYLENNVAFVKIKELAQVNNLNLACVINWVAIGKTPQEKRYIVHYENGIITTDEFIDGRFIYAQTAQLKVTHYAELPKPPYL